MYAILDIVTGEFYRPNGGNAITSKSEMEKRLSILDGWQSDRLIGVELKTIERLDFN